MAAAHPTRDDLTAEYVRSILDYDPETGLFRWKTRPDSMFAARSATYTAERMARIWNAVHVGKIAGTLTPATRRSRYRTIVIGNIGYRAHRLAWLHVHGEWPAGAIDHRDGDGLNNRIDNLRLATQSENGANVPRQKNNTSGFKGVGLVKSTGRWKASIRVRGTLRSLGCFDTPEEAYERYCEAAKEHFGPFARTS